MKFNEMITKIINRKFKYLKGIKSNTFLDLYLKENNLIKDDDLSLLYSELLNLPLYKGSTNKKTLVEIISLDLMEKTKTIYYENDDSKNLAESLEKAYLLNKKENNNEKIERLCKENLPCNVGKYIVEVL